jgi:hypothetical protein
MIVFKWTWFMRNITGLFDSDTGDKKGYKAMSFLFFIILRDEESRNDTTLITHEMIHFKQQLELLFVGQWFLYVLFYVCNLVKGLGMDKSYRQNPFEKEAYSNESNPAYLKSRKLYNWVNYI